MSSFCRDRRKILKRLPVIAFGTLSGFAGCKPSTKKSRIAGLTPEAKDLISEIAETIVPETDTPGAKSAGVGSFVVRILTDCRSQKERDALLKGLDEFERSCYEQFGHSFMKCTPQQKLSLVEKADREAFGLWSKIKAKLSHQDHYFRTLKELVLVGYFTSRQGATLALSYEPIPGKWIGCLDIKPGQKTWATQ